jgi:HD-GYP domain-containing protein (c-di-GMP phosphodiesterase class II)
MTHERPYQHALDHDETVAELKRCAGSHFDPVIVYAFCGPNHLKSRHKTLTIPHLSTIIH